MGCCDHSEVQAATGIKHKRSCTDILFLLLFICAWAGSIAIWTKAANDGADPEKIIRGVNYMGEICGKSEGQTQYPYAAWPYVLVPSYKICVADCATTKVSPNFVHNYSSKLFVHYCLPWFDGDAGINNSLLDAQKDNDVNNDQETNAETLARAIGDVYTVWHLFVIAAFAALVVTFAYTYVTKYIASTLVWMCVILLIIGGFSLGYVCLKTAEDYGASQDIPAIQYPSGHVAVTTNFVTCNNSPFECAVTDGLGIKPDYATFTCTGNPCVTADCCVALVDSANKLSPNRTTALKVLGWIFVGGTAIFLLVIIALRSRIKIAVEVVKEASRAINDVKSIVFFPILPIFLAIAYIVFWIAEALYIFSVSDLAPAVIQQPESSVWVANTSLPTNYATFEFRDSYRNIAFYHMFTFFWNSQFLFYFGYLVIAGTIADWYFTRIGPNGHKVVGDAEDEISRTPVCSSLGRATRYHLGTIALVSLIIAIIQTIRLIVKYIEDKLSGPEPNQVQRALFCCIQCCLKCVECCMDKVNKNALIWTAIWGDSFAVAACSSFKLIWNNLARVAALHVVSAFIFFIGKLAISTLVAGAFAWLLTSDKYEDEISSPILPVLIIWVVAYIVSSLFMMIFESAADTIFLCFLVDEQKNKGQMFASKGLKDLVDRHASASEEKAQSTFNKAKRANGNTNAVQPEATPLTLGK